MKKSSFQSLFCFTDSYLFFVFCKTLTLSKIGRGGQGQYRQHQGGGRGHPQGQYSQGGGGQGQYTPDGRQGHPRDQQEFITIE